MGEHSIAQARASVMLYNTQRKEWEHSGGSSGISRVHLYHHPVNNTYRIVGRKVQDLAVVVNCALGKGLKYNEAMPTFHQWRDLRQVYGLNFVSKEDAQGFGHAVLTALESINRVRNQDLSGADSQRRTSVLDRNQDLSGADSQRRTSVLDRFWGILLPREENSERESRETGQREENLQRQLRELQEREQNSQRQLTEFQQREENSQRQLREFQQREHELQQQLREIRQQLTNCQEQVSELQLSLSTAQQTISELRSQETSDWVISRDEIQITDKCLGRGGWGSVNEGTFCGCTVAVKQIHELILSPHNIHLFEREMNIASKCRHPHLLQFIGATNDEGNPLFVTELMEKSLRTLLEQRQLSEKEIAVISLDVARAINYLHQKKPEPIIHRDVSSANVLLWRQGDQWRGKVSDYGTANFMQQTMTVAPGAMIYSAPEALTSNQTVKVDVYSFGVLLCEMCIRQLPDPRRRNEQVVLVTNGVFRGLVRRCLQREPGARPTMQEIIDELKDFDPTS